MRGQRRAFVVALPAVSRDAVVGPGKGRQATLISEHATVAEAFREFDLLASEMVRTGPPSDALALIVVDADGRLVRRPDAQ